ncbi:MAG: HD domain-containing protein [Desulfurococcales archaeon]|nr:HD domain-containing protein [Desulfurococcales archaeon]
MISLFETNEKVKFIKDFSKMTMGNDPCHGWPHVERVAAYALKLIGNDDSIDYEALAIAVLLHDIGRFYQSDLHHAITSSKISEILLRGLEYPDDFIENVSHAIIAHSFSLGVTAKTKEAMILSDADKLDAIGAIGIYRVIYTSGLYHRSFSDSINHFGEKITRLKEKLYLPESKRIAEELHRRVELYVKWLKEELIQVGYFS